ncbi:Heavy metal transport/detoxification superfamily protein, putative [Theobroma cacao]|uniref:Heavy metal transport/detoxification superfamily protein, putative n=1 Tax=Theobroma cacao TaxID=3641 RepID=A0A061EJ41_THECC|nr:Heavy metal transport/detoxification superfamily protein, putative [Theobroma cacao]
MATVSAFSTPLHLISKTPFHTPKNLSFHPNSIHFQTKVSTFSFNNLTLSFRKDKNLHGFWKLKSAEEEETAVPEQEQQQEETAVPEQEQQQEETASAEQQESVSVPVSPSDTLRMYFQADGTLNEVEIPKVTKALESLELELVVHPTCNNPKVWELSVTRGKMLHCLHVVGATPTILMLDVILAAEGISNLKVQVLEGIGTVELTKQTTVQATGVASSLVEIIQGAGFKLQTLNLSFDDEEDIPV